MAKAKPPCPFCNVVPERRIITSKIGFALFDSYPLSEGHALVVPLRHVASVYDLEAQEQADMWRLVARVRQILKDKYRPDAFTIGVNDGTSAGQTVPHAHIHIIPRRKGDVPDPRGGIRWVIPDKAAYWEQTP